MKLSGTIPIYYAAWTIHTLLDRILVTGLTTEIILVNDDSSNGTRDLTL